MNIVIWAMMAVFSAFPLKNDINIDKFLIAALNKGDAVALSEYFTSTMKVSLNHDERILSKFQAELVISDYLKYNKFVEIKRSSQVKENNFNYLIYEAQTKKKQVRILMKVVKIKSEEFISEFRVE